ncbi:MAG: cation:proton antiporter [Bacteroidales bacterium]|nr:cation:proton antiporter [Bacteroidales bacterium]
MDGNTSTQILDIIPSFSLPITDHTWVFFLVLAIILLAPMLFSRLRIPHLIGMIIAGMLVGEHGLNLLERDDSFELFGQVGIYYIMFLAGLEMDLASLKQNKLQSALFGAMTALLPFVLGFAAGMWLLHYSVATSLLLACIFASHTLVSYPIVGRYRLTRHKSVAVSVTATMIALLFALLVLAGLAGTIRGAADVLFWTFFILKIILFGVLLFAIFPRVIRWFFRRFSDRVMQYIFVLGMVFLAAATAEMAGVEGILGAFLAGLVFNRFIPRSAPLMNRIEFVGNAVFIPYFLIGVGMLVNLKPLLTNTETQIVVLVMVVVGTLSKYVAAYTSRRLFRMSRPSGLMMFGLTEAHAAGALAMVMVGTTLMLPSGEPLMDNAVLDGVVAMILISCIISSVTTDVAARQLKMEEDRVDVDEKQPVNDDEKFLVLVNDTEKIPTLMQTAIMMRNPALNRGLIALNVVNDEDTTGLLQRHSRECLHMAEQIGAAADVKVQTQSRLAVNFVNGVVHAFRENDASEVIFGMHRRRDTSDSFFGQFANGLIDSMRRQIIMVNFLIPANTFRRIVVAVPERAQFEPGFTRWVERLARLAIEVGCRIDFHADEETAELIRAYLSNTHPLIRDEYQPLSEETSLADFAEHLADDHLFVVVTARHGTISYEKQMAKLQYLMQKHFAQHSFMIIYPDQQGEATEVQTFSEPHGRELASGTRISRWLSRWIRKIG